MFFQMFEIYIFVCFVVLDFELTGELEGFVQLHPILRVYLVEQFATSIYI